jgi:hypothetical protein
MHSEFRTQEVHDEAHRRQLEMTAEAIMEEQADGCRMAYQQGAARQISSARNVLEKQVRGLQHELQLNWDTEQAGQAQRTV